MSSWAKRSLMQSSPILTYGNGWQIHHDLGTGGVGYIGTNPADDYSLFQADLSFRFQVRTIVSATRRAIIG